MERRAVLRGIGVLGLPVVMPSSMVHDALTNPWVPPSGVRGRGLADLRASVEALWSARQASRYDQLTTMVPGVLTALEQRTVKAMTRTH